MRTGSGGRELNLRSVGSRSRPVGLCVDGNERRSLEIGAAEINVFVTRLAVEGHVAATDIHKHATPNTLQRGFATHLLDDGYDIRTISELLGHDDVSATMITPMF